MAFKQKYKWMTVTYFGNGQFSRPNAKKVALDLSLKVAGAALCYGIGTLVGDALECIPYLNEWIPQAVNYVSDIDVAENLDGLVGLMAGVNGFRKSGTRVDPDNIERLKYINLAPVKVVIR